MLNTAGVIYYLYYFNVFGYLPSAFIYDKSDTFMDFFNVLYWSYDNGRYTEWGSVYPPLCFLIIRLINFLFNGEVLGEPTFMRDGSLYVIVGICICYLAAPIYMLKTKYWGDFTGLDKILIYLTAIASAPMLFALERGNLLLIAPLLLSVAISTIGTKRCIFIALLINLKPYFVILMIYYIIKRNWKGLLTCSLVAASIFTITGALLDNQFFIFFYNIFNYSKEETLFSIREILALPSSISAFSYVLNNPDGVDAASRFLNPEHVQYLVFLIELVKWIALMFSLGVLFLRSNQIHDTEVLLLLVVIISNLGIWVGGYTLILYVSLIPVFSKMRWRDLYYIVLALMSFHLDVIPLLDEFIGVQYSYLGSAEVEVRWTLGLGSVVRPLINLTLLMLISGELFLRRKGLFDIVAIADRATPLAYR
jgi:hypothetical protein